MAKRPQVTKTTHPLPFERLSPLDFERLCLWVVRREGYVRARHIGAAGQDLGRDLKADSRDGEVLFQCKRVKRFGPKPAAKAVRQLLETAKSPPSRIILLVSCNVTERAEESARKAAGSVPLEMWTLSELDEQVKRHWEVLQEFFDLGSGGLELQRENTSDDKGLQIWLQRVGRQHRTLMPYFQRRGAPLLVEHVYVELLLDSQQSQIQSHQSRNFNQSHFLGRPMSIRQVLDLDPAEHPWIKRRWLLCGDPGSGKTTLLRHLALTLADSEGEPWTPILESLPRLMREQGSLFDRIEQDLRRVGLPGFEVCRRLKREAKAGKLLFLLDGLDEVPHELRDQAEEFLGDLGALWLRCPIVVSSRPIGKLDLGPDFRELEILPFDSKRRRNFLAQWCGTKGKPNTERAAEVADILEADRTLLELASNPLYLTMMALLVEEGAEPAHQRPRLFDQIFDLLEEGRHRKPPTPIDSREVAHQALRSLASGMTEDNRDSEKIQTLERRLLAEDQLRKSLLVVWPTIRSYLDDIGEKTGILGSHDGPETDWRFWHRTFREGLTAELLAEIYSRDGQAGITERACTIAKDDLSLWAEPYALLVESVENSDDLVRALFEKNRALGLRCIATAQSLKDETLKEILDLSEKWHQRRTVYERLPELVDDPLRALALIDQLRQRTRNGNDLYFLEQAAGTVKKIWPDAQRAADRLRIRFYDHIPIPSEELFSRYETPLGDSVDLWRVLPAGQFEMGAPIEEKWSRSAERPQHLVELTNPFRMAAVTVTVSQYEAFDPEHRSYRHTNSERVVGSLPVTRVTWFQAFSFCRWLSTTFEWLHGARLPTEKEWEYACRAGSRTRFWSGDSEDDLDRIGWYSANSGYRSHKVGGKPGNPWGLYDMHGNVWEWTQDNLTGPDQESSLIHDPSKVDSTALMDMDSMRRKALEAKPGGVDEEMNSSDGSLDLDWPMGVSSLHPVVRGGCFGDVAEGARAASRFGRYPEEAGIQTGFRVCLPTMHSEAS